VWALTYIADSQPLRTGELQDRRHAAALAPVGAITGRCQTTLSLIKHSIAAI
jgi:hypothetical protein